MHHIILPLQQTPSWSFGFPNDPGVLLLPYNLNYRLFI